MRPPHLPPQPRLGQALRDRAVEPNGLGKDQRAADAHAPAVEQMSAVHDFAHGGATEHDRFGQYETGVAGEIDVDRAMEPHPIEQDRLLRQPGERGACTDRELHADLGVRSERAIDFLGRGGGYAQPGSGADIDVDVEPVAARHPAGGVDDDGVELRCVMAVREAYPQRARFVHARAPAAAGNGRDRQRNTSDRAIGRECLIA